MAQEIYNFSWKFLFFLDGQVWTDGLLTVDKRPTGLGRSNKDE